MVPVDARGRGHLVVTAVDVAARVGQGAVGAAVAVAVVVDGAGVMAAAFHLSAVHRRQLKIVHGDGEEERNFSLLLFLEIFESHAMCAAFLFGSTQHTQRRIKGWEKELF